MAAAMSQLPPGFVVDSQPPEGFVVDVDGQEQEPRSASERVFRTLGLGARQIAETPALFMAGLSDKLSGVYNTAADVVQGGTMYGATKPESKGYRLPENRAQTVYEGFSQMGFPEAETASERVSDAIGRGIVMNVGTMGTGGALASVAKSPVTRSVGSTLTKAPAGQLAATATGSASQQIAAENDIGPMGQLAAGVIGGGLPAASKYGISAAARGAIRGGETGRQNMANTIDEFGRAGTTPSVGQATQGRIARATESGLSRTPGAAGRMTAEAERQAAEVSARLDVRANELAGKTSAVRAGKAIEEGIRGEGGFVERFRGTQSELYNKLDDYVPLDSRASVSNTQQTLESMTKVIAGAENTSGRMINPELKGIADALALDAADGTVPFEALKSLRSMVGKELETVSIVDDIPRAEWSRLYGALSEDLKSAAIASNDPRAMQAWSRANSYTRAGHERIKVVESALKRKGGPEKVFSAAMSGTKEGATVLRSVMQSLDNEGQRIVSATVLRRLGVAKAGVQNDLGDKFSTETFLTNWTGLSNEAKNTLFNRYGPGFRSNMDSIAKYASNLREGSQVFKNPSGTGQAAAQYTTAGAFVMSVFTGNFGVSAAIAGGVISANRLAALMTKPDFVKWLAQSTKVPASQIPAQIHLLAQLANKASDDDLGWAAALLEESYNDQSDDPQGR